MVDGVRTFDPVGAFQRGRQGAQLIQQRQQAIDAERLAGPRRNQLADIGLQQAQQTLGATGAAAGQAATTFGQQQELIKGRFIVQSNEAALQVPEAQRQAVFRALEPQAKAAGIDTSKIDFTQPFTDQRLQEGILAGKSIIQALSAGGDPAKFGRVVEGIGPGGEKVFFQAGSAGDQAQFRTLEGITPPKSQAQITFETKRLEAEQKKAAGAEAKKQQAGIVSLDIDRALNQAEGTFTTGFVGSIAAAVPGTPAFDLRATLDGIKANVGFNKLQEMRENSPTGGALGQVSENENRLLQSVFGSVEQSQSSEQLNRNLNRLKVIFDAIINGSAAIPFTQKQFDDLPPGTRYISPDTGTLHEKQ